MTNNHPYNEFKGELPLTGIRVLDLADERAALAGRVLADLGADVTLVEPPNGVHTRHLAPFLNDEPEVNRSYQHLYFNANKRSVVLDISTDTGANQLRELVGGIDILIETGHPDQMSSHGLGYDDLQRINPDLIFISVSPFGRQGPRRDWKATDLTASAAAGLLQVTGDIEDPPTHGPAFPAHTMSGLTAATAALVGLRGRDVYGDGAHVDISMQEATAFATVQTSNPNTWFWRKEIPVRPALSQTIKCADGKWVGCNISPLHLGTFLSMLDAAGVDHNLTPDDHDVIHSRGQATWQHLENPLQDLARELAAKLPRDEFLRGLWDGGHAAMPTLSFPEMIETEHYEKEMQFQDVNAPALGHSLSYSRSPVDSIQPPIPISSSPILGERPIGELLNFTQDNKTSKPKTSVPRMPLSGIRVLDFTWVLAGPLGTRMFANFGAEVIKIESSLRPDALRNQPLPNGRIDPNIGDQFNSANGGKKSVTINLTTERGKELVRQLVAKSDVIVNNYSAGAFTRMGFPYEELRKINPGIILLQLPGVGGDGPWSSKRTLGNLLMAASGLNFLAGFPGRSPRGMGVAYPDFTSPHLLVTTILAALRAREQTGTGREIELSQLSATVSLAGAEWMHFAHTGELPPRPGNTDQNYSPHGVYRTTGEDEWVALAVDGDRQWLALIEAMGRPELADDDRFSNHVQRKLNESELDKIISNWTATGDRWDLATRLQRVGIAASPVENLQDLIEIDEGFSSHYQHIHQPSDPEWDIAVTGEPIRFTDEQTRIIERAPMLGEHNEYVLREVLGLSQEECDELIMNDIVI